MEKMPYRSASSSRDLHRPSGVLPSAQLTWGTGVFAEGARLMVDFAIETIGGRCRHRRPPRILWSILAEE